MYIPYTIGLMLDKCIQLKYDVNNYDVLAMSIT